MMGTDGRDCTTCQNPNKGDMDDILEFVNEEKDKIGNSVVFPKLKRPKTGRRRGLDSRCRFCDLFRERAPSL